LGKDNIFRIVQPPQLFVYMHACTCTDTLWAQMYEELMYKSLSEQGFMKDDPLEELTWPWPLHLQNASSSIVAQASSEQVSCFQLHIFNRM
jgi:hypothetical protein